MNEPSIPDLPEVLTARIGFLLPQVNAAVQQLGEQALAGIGLTGREYGLLTLLAHWGTSTQRALGATLYLDRTTTMELLENLEDRGLVTRMRDPTNRRAYQVRLTTKGKTLRRRAETALSDCEQHFLAPLTPTQRTALHHALTTLATHHQPRTNPPVT